MRGKFAQLKPCLFSGLLCVILTIDLSNQWEVPVVGLPREMYDRYVDAVDLAPNPRNSSSWLKAGISRHSMSTPCAIPLTLRSTCS